MIPFKRSAAPDAPWYVSFMVGGRRYLWSTRTTDKKLANERAKVYRQSVRDGNFDQVSRMKQGGDAPIIDDLLKAYLAHPAPVLATRRRNASSMRIVMAASGIKGTDRVTRLDRSVVKAFQVQCLKKRPDDQSAIVTCNAKVRCARSVLSRRAVEYYRDTPNEVPDDVVRSFFSVPMLKEAERRPILPDEIVFKRVHTELPGHPRAWRVFLLGAYAGLRAGEIKQARRDWIEGTKLYVGGKEFVAKSRRWRVVELQQPIIDALLMSDDPVYLVGGSDRVQFVDREMPGILRDLGLPTDKPLHALRKLAGSMVYNTQGARQARDFLGHQAQSTTDRFYARSKDAPAAIPFAG